MAESAISQLLECPVCQDTFTQPYMLSCQHTFCRHCLEDIIGHQENKDIISCPICRAQHELSTAGIKDLHKNIFAANLIDILKMEDQKELAECEPPEKSGAVCSVDPEECSEPAAIFCDICDVYMCKECEVFHKENRFTRKHETSTATQARLVQHAGQCPKHTSKKLDMFCDDCDVAVCSYCLSTSHESHRCRGLSSRIHELRTDLTDTETLLESLLTDVDKVIDVTKEKALKVKEDADCLRSQTSAAYSAIQRTLQKEAERDLASIDDYYGQADDTMDTMLDKQQKIKLEIKSLHSYSQHLSNGTADDIMTNLKTLVKRSRDQAAKPPPEILWSTDVHWSQWGIIGHTDRVTYTNKAIQKPKPGNQQQPTLFGEHNAEDDENKTRLSTFTTQCSKDVVGMSSYHDHLFLVHGGDDMVYVYTNVDKPMFVQSSRIFCVSSESCMRWPLDVILVHNEGGRHSLVISDYVGQCLWWTSLKKRSSDVQLTNTRKHKLYYRPWKLGTDTSGRALVTDNTNGRLYIYNQPGPHVKCVQLSPDLSPCQAISDQNDGYVITHGVFNGQLVWVDSSGQELHRYDDNHLVSAYHIIDDGARVLVTDRAHHKVHIVTREGKHRGHLITDSQGVRERKQRGHLITYRQEVSEGKHRGHLMADSQEVREGKHKGHLITHSQGVRYPTCVCLDPGLGRVWISYKNKLQFEVMQMPYTPKSSSAESSMTTDTTCLSLTVTLPKIA